MTADFDALVEKARAAFWPAYSAAVRVAPSNRNGQGITARDAEAATRSGYRAALEAAGLPALLEDNEQLRASVNRDFGEPLDEVYKTDGITIVMQQIHDLRREKAALLERVEAAEAKVVEATGDEYELQQARMEALYERIADRLGEHDAARNVSEGGSEEQVTILTAGWPVEDLARFIVDDLEYDFIAPIQRDALAAKVADAGEDVAHLRMGVRHQEGLTAAAWRDAKRAEADRDDLRERVQAVVDRSSVHGRLASSITILDDLRAALTEAEPTTNPTNKEN